MVSPDEVILWGEGAIVNEKDFTLWYNVMYLSCKSEFEVFLFFCLCRWCVDQVGVILISQHLVLRGGRALGIKC